MTISFFVRGTPRPGGSKTAMPIYGKAGHAITKQTATGKFRPVLRYVDDAKGNKEWRQLVATEAKRIHGNDAWFSRPLRVEFCFYVKRPKSHYRTNGELKPGAPRFPTIKPDVLKLARSTEDALTKVLWEDDAENVRMALSKDYSTSCTPEGCAISITDEI